MNDQENKALTEALSRVEAREAALQEAESNVDEGLAMMERGCADLAAAVKERAIIRFHTLAAFHRIAGDALGKSPRTIRNVLDETHHLDTLRGCAELLMSPTTPKAAA